jgi:superfamily II DNA or RNA helicase
MTRVSLNNINCWEDFKSYVDALPNTKAKGDAFEHLTYLYFKINPKYSFYDEVYKMSHVPSKVLELLKIPQQDLGIDLIAKVGDEYHPIQCKYHKEKKRSIKFDEVSTFLTQLESNTNFNMGYIASSADTTSSNYNKLNTKQVQKLLSNTWFGLDKDFFDKARKFEKSKAYSPDPYYPREHQIKAIKKAYTHFIKENNSRGKLIFPCGAGKSLTGFWMMEKFNTNSTLVAVPSLSLIKQTLDVYLKEVVSRNLKVKWLCICSDEGIGKNDDILFRTSEIGVPCTTNPDYIKKWLKDNKNEKIIIFTTYQSGRLIAEASKSLKFTFDLGVYDEAHKTVGKNENLFSYLLFEENISVKHRIFMTATERFYRGVRDDVLTMDDPDDYGDVFCHMSFKEAIEEDLLTDYKIITIEVKKEEIAGFIKDNNLVKSNDKWGDEKEARSLASMIALRKAMKRFPIKNAVSFHSSIERATRNKDVQEYITNTYNYKPIDTYHVSGKLPTSKREIIVNEFAKSDRALITNSRCLTEGVDVPNIDCIVFADPRKSKVDIVQALGRALRKKDGKDFGYVVLPVIYDHTSHEIDNENFQEILNVIRGLAANDERIIEEFKDKSQNSSREVGAREEIFSIDPVLIEESELVGNLNIKLWEKLSKFSWMSFEEAREYVRGLGLRNQSDWKNFINSKERPYNLPYKPERTYENEGWIGLRDFIGSNPGWDGTFKPFIEAREYVRGLKIRNQKAWNKYTKTKEKPSDIPASPEKVYKSMGWIDLGDWLGTGTKRKKEFYPFNKARKVVRALNLKGQNEWRDYRKSGLLNKMIPSRPDYQYQNEGWISFEDFIGSAPGWDGKYVSFSEAKKIIKKFKINTKTEWGKFVKGDKKPFEIPSSPRTVYKSAWKGWGDFLGTGTIAPQNKKYISYKTAQKIIAQKNISSWKEFNSFKNSSTFPKNFPSAPQVVYKKEWKDFHTFLGKRKIKYLDFKSSRDAVRKLDLRKQKEWQIYSKTKRPPEIPSNPSRFYENEWKGWADFLGKKD